jgi:hypothetical protein
MAVFFPPVTPEGLYRQDQRKREWERWEPHYTETEQGRTEILLRDKYQCTVIHDPLLISYEAAVRAHNDLLAKRLKKLRERIGPHRCVAVGSEMVVRNGQTMCPRHARKFDEGELAEWQLRAG